MRFSRLNDTDYPDLGTADPYAIRNTFDYTRWVPGTKVRLVNVLWGGDYSNVVKFESDTARDAWFDRQAGHSVELLSNARIVPDGTVKLPLPYDVAARYNYLYVDIPIATSADAMIQDETSRGVRRWYFFVGDVSYSAPNTTIVSVSPDVWTNFINEATLTYMMLRRGHAPVSASDTDRYLANPIANNRYLLAPDVNYDDTDVVRHSKLVPFGDGEKWICLASTVSYAQMRRGDCGTVSTGTSFTDPTFSDTSDWFGYQLQVDGFGWGNGSDYSGTKAPVEMYNRPGARIPTGLDVYAVPASDSLFLSDVREQCPAFLRTVKGMFVVSRDMLTLGNSVAFCGHTLRMAYGTYGDVADLDLDKGMFGFTTEEERFAKLYTYPYSRLEVTDMDGRSAEVRIEGMSNGAGVRMFTALAFPVLDCRVFLTGINGVGSTAYEWRALDNEESWGVTLPNGDWEKLCFDLDIPTYTIYMDGETAFYLDSYSGMENARDKALSGYHSSVRSANATYTNSVASAANAHTVAVNSANTAQSNANDSAGTAQTNATASADTAQSNSNAMAGTTQTNTNNQASCNYTNVGYTIAANTANTNSANGASTDITTLQNNTSASDMQRTNTVNYYTQTSENETSIATTANTGNANMAQGVISGAQSGAMAGGGDPIAGAIYAGAGAVLGGISAGIGAYAANQNAYLVAQTNEAVTTAAINANAAINSNDQSAAIGSTGYSNTSRTDQTNNNNTCLDGQRTNNQNTANTNAKNLYDTQTANSARTRNTNVANAGRTYTTTTGNSARTRNTNVSNADSTQSTSNANASRSRQVSVLNAQENLRAAQGGYEASARDAARRAPIALTEQTGDAKRWFYGTNGLQIRIRTQSDSAIAQAASQFARYGYALNQVWDVRSSGLCLMENFTYWQANDVWVDVRNQATSEVADEIGDIFENGVTIWSDPERIGKVSIYDN